MRGISLDEIAEATKIGTRSLRALESEDFEKLPGGIFNKGFVRAYAKYLGIDEEQAVSDYMAAIGEKDAALPATEGAKAELGPKLVVTEVTEPESSSGIPLAVAAGVLLLVAVFGVAGWKLYQWQTSRVHAASKPAQHAPVAVAAPEQEPSPVTATPETAPSTSALPSSKATIASTGKETAIAKPISAAEKVPANSDAAAFELLIRANQDSWLSITADGKPVMSGILKATSEKSVKARDKVILKIGNAGGVEISHNGKPVPLSGESGQTKTVTFTSEGIQQ